MKIEVGRWHHLKIELVKDSVRVLSRLRSATDAVFVDPNPLRQEKWASTFVSQAAIGPIRVVTENGEWITNNEMKVEAPTPDDYYRLALAAWRKSFLTRTSSFTSTELAFASVRRND